jgi:uncharacterized protein YcaQ
MRLSAATLPILLKAMMEQPRTAQELIEATGLGHDGVHLFCQAMHEQGLAHIVWWDYHDSQYAAVYAFGAGQDTTERWNETEQALLKIFAEDLLSRTAQDLAKTLDLHTATVKRSLNALADKSYLVRNKTTDPVTWRRNPHVAFPDRRGAASDAALRARPAQWSRPQVAQQSWYSPIV